MVARGLQCSRKGIPAKESPQKSNYGSGGLLFVYRILDLFCHPPGLKITYLSCFNKLLDSSYYSLVQTVWDELCTNYTKLNLLYKEQTKTLKIAGHLFPILTYEDRSSVP